MKTFLNCLLFLSLLNIQIIKPQEIVECGTLLPEGITLQQVQSGDLSLYKRTSLQTLRLAIHIVQFSDGSGGITQPVLDEKIISLNNYFSQVLFQFEIKNIDFINSDVYASLADEEMNGLRLINSIPGFINIYFVPIFLHWDGYSSYSPRVLGGGGVQGIIIANNATRTTLPHEMGHYFDLLHTYDRRFGEENIAREGSCANWNSTGDLLKGTPADPYDGYVNDIDTNCMFIPNSKWRDGCNQTNYSPSTHNMMITQQKDCRTGFTEDQINRMNETLLKYRSELFNPAVYLSNNIGSVNAGGKLQVGNQDYVSGKFAAIPKGTYDIKTNNERFSNFQSSGLNYKHNNWNDQREYSFLSKIDTILQDKNMIAKFIPIRFSKIEAKLDGLSMPNQCSFQFQDPWYLKSDGSQPGDYWITANGQYEPTGKEGAIEKGVFLNQIPDPQDPAKPYYSVKAEAVQDIYLSQTGKTHRFYFQNWTGTNANFQNVNVLETPVVFTLDGATAQANLKGTQLSSQTNAITGNGQKKLVKISDGHLHQTYESLNKVWYERSIDNGTTWEIMNGGKPISGSYYSKQPSMDYYNTAAGKVLVIVYQAYDENGSYVNASIFKDGSLVNTYVLVSYNHDIGVIGEVNTTPVVSINPDGRLLFAWYLGGAQDVIFNSPDKGIYYRYGNLYFGSSGIPLISWFTSLPVHITRTSITSINPTLDAYKTSVQPFQLAYENNNQIYYHTLTDDANQTTHLSVSSSQNISTGSGYTYNNKPSILAWNEGSRVVWEGNNSGYKKRVIFRSPGYSYFWSFNNSSGTYDCLNPNINRPDDYSAYYFSWSENNYGIMNNNSLSYSGIKNLGISGQHIQLSNGATPEAMYATTLNSTATPYYFTQSASLGSFYRLSKISELFAGSEGRKGVVYKDSAEFYFNFGKITVDDNNIGYVKINEEETILDEKTINQYLRSQPFNLSDNSSFTFNIQYGVTDTVNANAVLEDNDYVSFKLQLVDYATSEILGEYNNVRFTKSNLSEHNNQDYLVNTKGIGNKTVILKLIVETNIQPNFALTLENSGNARETLNKEIYKEILYNNDKLVTEYALVQNFPNPFNPSTTIKYQLPQDGLVTLKIYDILGKEVTTLINEEKPAGKYEVNFNASQLASGVYIYKIQAGSFVSSKKMILLK